MKKPIQISASTLVSSLGKGRIAHLEKLKKAQTGLTQDVLSFKTKLSAYYGEVAHCDQVQIPDYLSDFDCRNHQLAWLALTTDNFNQAVQKVIKKRGAQRIGLAVGTSTSGILATEEVLAYKAKHGHFHSDYDYQKTHRMDALAEFCAQALAIEGPRLIISTACSSSAKVFATASRWLDADLVDAVVVGGVDTLCLTTIHGFNSLKLISSEITQPLDQNRNGINIGEAGGFMLLEPVQEPDKIQLTGFSETSDAYHISTPHPDGEGAKQAMLNALKMAQLKPHQIDYLNLHGTGTPSNDLAEAKAVNAVFNQTLPLHSSTKGFTGHTLGAAGITEAIFCQWALEQQFVPANLNLQQLDPALMLNPVTQTTPALLQHCLTNSFGFGGNNACLIFSKEKQ